MDPFFYAGICESIADLQLRYEIFIARQLPGSTGGKQALLNFFAFLRRSKALVSSLGGQRACIFFLDKDVDDLQRKKKRSQHTVYTEHYDVQNYIFIHGQPTDWSSICSIRGPCETENPIKRRAGMVSTRRHTLARVDFIMSSHIRR